MELTNVFSTIESTSYKATTTGAKLEQKASREIKANVLNALMDALVNAATSTAQVKRTADGIAVSLDNEIGWITVTFDATVKNLDYDIEQEAEDFEKDKADKAARAAERKALSKAKAERDKAAREKAKANGSN